jgi:hypothetical protein
MSVCVCLCIPPIVAGQRLGRNVTPVTNTHATIEELLDASFSMRPVSYQCRRVVLPRTSCLIKLFTVPEWAEIAQSLQWEATGLLTGVRFRTGAGIFLISWASEPAPGLTQPPIQQIPGALYPGVKRPGLEAVRLPPSNAEFKNGGTINPLPDMSLWRGA